MNPILLLIFQVLVDPDLSIAQFRAWHSVGTQEMSVPKEKNLLGQVEANPASLPPFFPPWQPLKLWFPSRVNYSCLLKDIKLALPRLPAGWGKEVALCSL